MQQLSISKGTVADHLKEMKLLQGKRQVPVHMCKEFAVFAVLEVGYMKHFMWHLWPLSHVCKVHFQHLL